LTQAWLSKNQSSISASDNLGSLRDDANNNHVRKLPSDVPRTLNQAYRANSFDATESDNQANAPIA
jgi:hypothetical protein